MVGATALSLEGLVAVDPDVVRLRRGDLSALSELITRYQNRLYRYLLRIVRQPAEAEDLFQQTWLRVVEKIRSFDASRNFDAWLFTLAHHRLCDFLTRRNRQEQGSGDSGAQALLQELPAPESLVQDVEEFLRRSSQGPNS